MSPSFAKPRSSKGSMALLAAVAIALPLQASKAAVVTFQLTGMEGHTTYDIVSSGLTLSLKNPLGSGFGDFASGMFNAGDYIDLATDTFPIAFDFSFDQPVKVLSYDVQISNPNTYFNLTGPGGASSLENSMTATGSQNIGGTFELAANANGHLTVVFPDGAFQHVSFTSITVETVPEPGTCLLLGLTGAAAMARRRRVA